MDHPDILNARGGGMTRMGFGFDHDFGFPFVPPASQDRPGAVGDVLFPSGAAMAMRTADFDRFRFDPAFFMYHEDVDLGWRLNLAGYRVVVCDDSLVYHKFGGTSSNHRGTLWRERMGSRHNFRSIWKNYEFRNALSVSGRHLRSWIRGRRPDILAGTLVWNLVRIPGTLRLRREIQASRRIRDDDLFARGLVSGGDSPAVPPRAPLVDIESHFERLIEHPVLLPGHYSSLGRLGPGWYAPEDIHGDLARRTCGSARCLLRVAPGARGMLDLWFHVPREACPGFSLDVRANANRASFTPTGRAWDHVSLPAEADDRGRIAISLSSPAWIPNRLFADGDERPQGCCVRKLAFEPGTPATAGDTAPGTPGRRVPLRASVVITTYNRKDILILTLDALAAQDCDDFEVVLVNDGSTDGTPETVELWRRAHPGAFHLESLRQENAGQGMARNAALRLARNEIVIFIGDDIVPEPDFVRQHLKRHASVPDTRAFVGHTDWYRGRMKVTSSLVHVNNEGYQFGYRHMREGGDVPYTCFYTSNISIPRRLLEEDRFDPAFTNYGWEDIELGYRLSLRGLRIVYASSARAKHLHPATLAGFCRRQRDVGRRIHRLFAMHPAMAADEAMPRLENRGRPTLRSILATLAIPAVDALDQAGIRIPGRVLDTLLGVSFDRGVAEGRRTIANGG